MVSIKGLKKRADFLAVAATQQKSVTPGLILQARLREVTGVVRVGFTVTKKVGNAVVRNRIKRRLRALAVELLPTKGKAGHDYVLIGRRLALHRDYRDLKKDLAFALKRIKTKESSP